MTTKIPAELSSTPGISDSSDATAITIDSSENVGIGTTSPNAILTTDPESGNFSSTYNNYDGVGLFIRGNGTSGNGNYGPALVFGSCDSDTANQDHKHSAISIVQTDTDPNQTGLAFWTHPSATSTDALSESMRIDAAGNVGIGTTSPDRMLHVKDSASTVAKFASTGNIVYIELNAADQAGGDAGYIKYNNTKDLSLWTDDTERVTIDSSGNLCIGTTSAHSGAILSITSKYNSSSGFTAQIFSSDSTEQFSIRGDGAFYTGLDSVSPYNLTTGNNANAVLTSEGLLRRSTSSLRYKKDIADATWGLTEVKQLRPITFKSNTTGEFADDKTYGGLIAEEVHDIGLTEFVEYNDSNEPDALHYGNMVALLTKAIQEQQELIETLTARIETLEGGE